MIRFGDKLPKTRSGKIMRRLLRVQAAGEPITQDISTLKNPTLLEQFGGGTASAAAVWRSKTEQFLTAPVRFVTCLRPLQSFAPAQFMA